MRPLNYLVVGLGNPLQGADGFGAAVLERLRSARQLPPGTELVDATTDLLSLFDRFPLYDVVVLVDALLGAGPREVRVISEQEFDAWTPHAASAHETSPLVALGLFRTLQPASTTRFVLVGLKVGEDEFDAGLLTSDAQAGADAVRRIVTMPVTNPGPERGNW
jgi:hydrogenase maturation protease